MGLMNRFNPKNHLVAKGAEDVHGKDAWLDNDDVRPLKLADRTWSQLTYFTFWFSATATVSNWYGASTAQALGLSMWESIVCQLGGQVLIAAVITVNGRAGAVYHVGFPILNRAAFGVYGVMLHAIFPSIARLHNVMGEGSALDSGGMIGLMVFWIATCCFLVIPVPKMKGLVYTKLVVFLISAIAMLAWCLSLAGGIGSVARQGPTVYRSEKSWLICQLFFLAAANCATFASNAADFQRYAKKPNNAILGNIVGFPLSNFIVCLVSNFVAAASQKIYGEVIWNPLTLLDMLQTSNYTSANRAGCFFIAAMFAYSAIFSSIFENSLPAGNDIAALFPKYISVRKGMYIAQALSVAVNQWYLLASAIIFVEFLGSYEIFLSSITGVLLCNYYITSRGYFNIPDLYTSRKDGDYHYIGGWNWRAYVAYVAYVIASIPNFPGFLGNMGVAMPLGITRFYYFAYPFGLVLSCGVFWLCNIISPPKVHFPLSEWREPKDYIRPEEDVNSAVVIEGEGSDTEKRGFRPGSAQDLKCDVE